MGFLATVNVPGYLPEDNDPPVFDTPQEAWQYLADERERGEDSADYSDFDPDRFGIQRHAPLSAVRRRT